MSIVCYGVCRSGCDIQMVVDEMVVSWTVIQAGGRSGWLLVSGLALELAYFWVLCPPMYICYRSQIE